MLVSTTKQPKVCKFDAKCTKAECTFHHTSRIKCKHGANCTNSKCTFQHPPGAVKPQPNKKNNTKADDRLPKLLPIPCEYKDECANMECLYEHENRKKCRHGPDCHKISCTFDHSSLVNPSRFNKRQQNKMKDLKAIESDSDDDSSTEETMSTVSDSCSTMSDDSEFVEDYELEEPIDSGEPSILDTFSKSKPNLENLKDPFHRIKSEFSIKMKLIQDKQKENTKLIENDYNKYRENKYAIKAEEELLLKQQETFENETARILNSNAKMDLKLKAIERELKRATNLFPFYAYRKDIVDSITKNDVLLIVGQTGSGKSTQIPQYLLEAGIAKKKIVCTQPRKVAAQSLAKRIREEMLCTDSPLIRSNDKKLSPEEWRKNKLMFMTDRALLHELLKKKMKNYSCVIIDEAHERTVFTDILLCELKQLYKERKQSGDPLKIIITSATIDENLFSTYFDNCPIIRVPGQLYPVEVYWEKSEDKYVDQSVRKVVSVLSSRNKSKDQLTGDILVFLTNPEEIDSACHKLKSMLKNKSFLKDGIEILPLHGKIPAEDQQKALNPLKGKTKIIFSSNIAETSVTINGVTTIIDSGRVKERTFDQNRNISLLKVNYISQSSSKQRRGRAGRTQPGECYNLYTMSDFEQFSISQAAEIFRSHLGSVLLQIILHSSKRLSIDLLTNYDLIEKPSPKDVKLQLEKLISLGFVEITGNYLRITKSGEIASQLYMEPSVSKMIIEGINNGIPSDILKVAAITTVSNIVFQRSKDEKDKDNISVSKISSSQKEGDLYSLYLLFDQFLKKKSKERSQFCKDNHLNYSAFNMASTTLQDLKKSIRSLSSGKESMELKKSEELKKSVILDSIICGLFSNFAYYSGKSSNGNFIYKLLQLNLEACLHPSSVLFSEEKPPSFVLFYELMRTEKLYMKNVTPVDVDIIQKYNNSFDYSIVKQYVKKPYTRKIPKSAFPLLKARGGELIEQLERDLGVLVEVDEGKNELTMELSQSEEQTLKPKIENFLKQLRERISKQLYEYIPNDQKNIRALVGSGLNVVNILTSKEFMRINFRISIEQKSERDVQQLFSQYGSIREFIIYPNNTSSQKLEGYVTFEDNKVAEKTYNELKNEIFIQLFPSALTDNTQLEIDENVPFIQLKYFLTPCKGKASVEFPNHQSAMEACQVLNGSLGRAQVAQKNLKYYLNFDQLPQHFTESHLAVHLHTRKLAYSQIVFHRDECSSLIDSDMIATQLHSLFTQFKGLEVMELLPVDEKESKKFIKALVKYNNKRSADNAIQNLQGIAFGAGTLQLYYKVDQITIPTNVYESINKKKVLDTVFESIFYEHQIKVTFSEIKFKANNKKTETGNSGKIKFETVSNLSEFEKAKRKVDDIISHSTIKIPFSHKAAVQRKFPKIKEATEKTNPEILLSFDARSSSIKVFGPQRETVAKIISRSIESSKIREIKVRNMKAIVGNGGSSYDDIKKCIKGSVQLNLKKRTLEADCSEADFEILKKKVEEIEFNYNGTSSTNECEICCNDINPNNLTFCDHICCQACLSLQVDGFNIESGLLCCNSCQQPLPFMDILCSFDNDAKKLHQPCNILLERYIASNKTKWTYCNTCQNLSRVTGVQSYFCIVCDKDYCLKCHKNSHQGPCVDYEKLFDEYKRRHTKSCPICKTPIEKNDGCNHMTCRACPNHFCWLCGFSATSGSQIYSHQSSCPGDRYF